MSSQLKGVLVCLFLLQTEDYLKRKIRSRPERSELVRMHILEGMASAERENISNKLYCNYLFNNFLLCLWPPKLPSTWQRAEDHACCMIPWEGFNSACSELFSEKSVVWIQIVQFCIGEQQWNRMTMDCSSAKGRHCKMSKRDWGRFDLISNKPQLQRGSAMLLLSTKLGAQPGGTVEWELGYISLRAVNLSKGLL